jgi:hypothetical protein
MIPILVSHCPECGALDWDRYADVIECRVCGYWDYVELDNDYLY